MLRRTLLALIFTATATSVIAQSSADFVSQRYNQDDLTGKMAPQFNITPKDGKSFSLKSLRGHPILLIFWSTWCENCTSPIRQLPPLLSGTDIQVVAINFDRDPALATSYLQSHQLSVPDFHDNGSIRGLFHLSFYPAAVTVLIDETGRIIFSQRAIFHEELLAAIAQLRPQYAQHLQSLESPLAPLTTPETSFTQDAARELAHQAVTVEASYLGQQKSFTCRYDVTTRDHYDSGMSVHSIQHLEEVFATDGHQLESHLLPDSAVSPLEPVASRPDSSADAAVRTFTIWSDPVFAAVINHSVFSNLQPSSYDTGRINSTPAHMFLYLTFRGDPTYKPTTDAERIAQSLEGWLVLDTLNHVLVMLNSVSAYDVTDAHRFLMERYFPVLDFRAVPFHGAYLPSIWSSATYQSVPNTSDAKAKWLATLTRTFGQRKSCEIFHVTTTILPGFNSVSPPSAK